MGKGTAESTLCALFKNPRLFRNFLYGSFESGFLQLSLECFQLLCRHTGNLDCHLLVSTPLNAVLSTFTEADLMTIVFTDFAPVNA